MLKRITLILIVFVGFVFYAHGQCDIEILKPTKDTTICEGDSLQLVSDGSCTFLMNNTFDNGTIGSGWSSTAANPVFTNPCGQGPGGAHLWVGTTNSQERTLITNPYDVSSTSCVIKWWMRYGKVSTNGDCEDPDEPDEGVHLQYSTNSGNTWTDFPGPDLDPVGTNATTPPFQGNTTSKGRGGYWEPDGVPPSPPTQTLYYWHEYEDSIPAAAATTSTQFRWAQLSTSDQGYDAWGIDEVEIYCPGQQNVSWSNGIQAFNAGWVKPSSTKTYTVFILDTSGNAASANVTVNVIPEPDPKLGPDTTICADPGSYATLEADTGYDTYQWNTGAISRTIQVDSSAQYKVTVTDGNCVGKDSVNVTVAPTPTANAGTDKDICVGDSATFTASQVSGYYAWSTGDSTKSITVSPQKDSAYFLTVASSLGCKGYDTVNLTVHPLPNADAGPDKEICFGEQTDLNASGGQVYEWNTGDKVSSITVSPDTTKNYYVTVTDKHSCQNQDTATVTVFPLPDITAEVADSIICLGEETELYASGAESYDWSNGATGDNITIMPMSTKEYTVTGTDTNGCQNTASVVAKTEDCSTFFIPNAFSPNGDGINDVFKPKGDMSAVKEYEFKIFDRYGNIIFQTEDVNEGWDGRIDGELAPNDSYAYLIYYKSVWGKEFTKKGTVIILR
ncbi:MAG: gliding motility-associated C-terminal domain-containing protein [Bacteroidales bacterium]|nr:gliding motility-associated C-terminal domain-containing protein [Bacteroidales bacterium]